MSCQRLAFASLFCVLLLFMCFECCANVFFSFLLKTERLMKLLLYIFLFVYSGMLTHVCILSSKLLVTFVNSCKLYVFACYKDACGLRV